VSPYDKPTRAEALIYYRKVVDKYDLQISLDETVLSVSPEVDADVQPPNTLSTPSSLGVEEEDSALSASSAANLPTRFSLETRTSRGVRRVRHARHVLFAIGYYDHPVRLGVPGEDLPHVRHYYGEPHPYYRQRVVIVGGGNSAAEAALEMYRAGAHVTLVHRASELKSTIKYWVRPDIENRIKEGSVAARFNTCIAEIRPTSVVVRTGEASGASGAGEACVAVQTGGDEEIPADAVFLLTGYRADADLLRRAGVELNERDAPVYNPETFETNVPGLFIAGGAIAGVDTGTIFIENGRFHGERIVETIASRAQD
jgi:thioredoxin reductase (NADPH)